MGAAAGRVSLGVAGFADSCTWEGAWSGTPESGVEAARAGLGPVPWLGVGAAPWPTGGAPGAPAAPTETAAAPPAGVRA
jgi:hypothetical protein